MTASDAREESWRPSRSPRRVPRPSVALAAFRGEKGPGAPPARGDGVGSPVRGPAGRETDEVDEVDERSRRRAAPRRPAPVDWRRRLRRQRRVTLASMVVLVALGAGLAGVGWGRVRGSRPGEYVDPSLRPNQPGYVALVTPTPTRLVVHRGADDALAGVTLLALRSRDEGGSVIVMPVATRARHGDDEVTLASAYADGGAPAVARAAGNVLGVDVGTPVELDDAALARLLAPVAPLSLRLERDVGDWPAGEIALSAEQTGAFLGARRDDETELGRLPRQEAFWQAWLGELGGRGADAIPGEDDTGLGRFLHGLTGGPRDVVSLPVAPVPGAPDEVFAADGDMVATLVAEHVPYPREPSPGSRVRVRLLNGTRHRDLTVQVVPLLVEAGAEIGLSGNAESFDRPRTRLVYSSERQREDVEALRDALGFGDVEASAVDETTLPAEESERIDVTVILGADASAAMRRSESTE